MLSPGGCLLVLSCSVIALHTCRSLGGEQGAWDGFRQ